MEAVYGTSKYVNGLNGGTMAYADGDLDRPVAVVQANIPKIQALAQELGVSGDAEALCADAQIRAAVTADLNKAGKGKLSQLEVIGTVHLVSGSGPPGFPGTTTSPWTPENGFLTASNKTDRSAILNGKRKDVD